MLAWLLTVAALAGPDGTYVLSIPKAEADARIEAQVEAAAQQWGVFAGIARGRIRKGTSMCEGYVFDFSDGVTYGCTEQDIRLHCPPETLGKRHTLQLLGGPKPTTFRWDGDTLTVVFEGEDGTRTNRFAFEGDTLRLTATVESDKLDTPMVWTLPYRRAGGASPSAAGASTER